MAVVALVLSIIALLLAGYAVVESRDSDRRVIIEQPSQLSARTTRRNTTRPPSTTQSET